MGSVRLQSKLAKVVSDLPVVDSKGMSKDVLDFRREASEAVRTWKDPLTTASARKRRKIQVEEIDRLSGLA